MVERAFVLPPASQIGPIDAAKRQAVIAKSLVAGVCEQAIDRESAQEMISAGVAAAAKPAPAGPAATRAPVQAMMKSAARSIGSQVGSAIIRGVLGSILKK